MKAKISKVYFEKMKKSSIKELIENINISSKFKHYEENINKEIILEGSGNTVCKSCQAHAGYRYSQTFLCPL